MERSSTSLLLFVAFSCAVVGAFTGRTYDVMEYNAAGDGQTDDTQAFLAAWDAACRDGGDPTFYIPSGRTFLLGKIDFNGPCKSPIHVQVDGNILRTNRIWGDNARTWILFIHINGLRIYGSGQLDGQGSIYWTCKQQHKCMLAPNTLQLLNNANVELSGLSFINSAGSHVVVGYSQMVDVRDLTITAPANSPNTDGIHVEQCRDIQISHSIIGTGDDCVSIGTGCINVTVSDITCGPGHGISIGSLGAHGTVAEVEQINVLNSRISHTQNGVRIKSYQGGSGYARGILFQNINLTEVKNPIFIDQYYCPHKGCTPMSSAVSINDVRYIGIIGTTTSDAAISLHCSSSVSCDGILLDTIYIRSASAGGAVTSNCINAHGTKKGVVVPDVTCLSP